MKRIFAPAGVLAQLVAGTSAAQAHGGHIGEVAGHAHWIGIAAVAAAATLAAGVALAGRKRRSKATVDGDETAETAPNEGAA
ncbi:DUF6732 family protein [Stappia sp. ES.058]|uniref:DUF6732 family protein n=1 Tax=Stappia sp. ES.058 TaxID=1881061 RepID=UPI00087C334D|nr:DUF6732 family protein [Stappia sp. ES.058]SDU48634.1 hypothetical protein SAMN05428979_4290 [Stappia sp. ES.058]